MLVTSPRTLLLSRAARLALQRVHDAVADRLLEAATLHLKAASELAEADAKKPTRQARKAK